jgi:hypothetical protein
MKKLLALVLVLGCVSLANAAFILEATPSVGGDYVITVSCDTAVAPAGGSEMYWALLVDAGSLTDAGAMAKQTGVGFDMQLYGDISGAGLPGIGTWGTLFTTGGAIPAGILFDGFVANGAMVVSLVQILPDFSGYGDTVATAIIPEPATMALLALGGLLFRRK